MDRRSDPDEAEAERRSAPLATPAEIRLGVLGDYIGFHLRQAQNVSFRAFKRQTGDSDLRPGWFAVLTLIDANPGITPILLSRASGRDKSTLTPVIRDLTYREFIRRMPVPGDKRSYGLALTAAGKKKLKALAHHAAVHDTKLDEIAGAKKTELIALLRRISALLD
jgi:DNA-binding MarR family transcriptional regulator